MLLQNRIMQAEMLLTLKQTLLKAKRCTQTEVDYAHDELLALRLEAQGHGTAKHTPMANTNDHSQAKSYDEYQAELSKQAKQLTDQQAGISNQLVAAYQHSPTQNMALLMQQAIALRNEAEKVWDKKKFLERNGYLPAESTFEAVLEETETPENHLRKMAFQQERKLIKDQLLKLEKKIADPTKYVKYHKAEEKVNGWKKQVMIYQEQLNSLNLKLQV